MTTTALTRASSQSRSHRLLATLASILLGMSLVYFAGFSHLELVHNAAHDTRHSSGFPCH
ncbi:cobalt transporter [Metapseudomonas lalkuanensis]|uniref:Cobalt transporter n=1 Tax=Metapseudomonas lalkuanensis TaxID=2604832 RepID=A0A5J6QNY9_9GAMM|nr:CbtB domain-containing protein [Pseudomonas lalkuanensis]QEY63031.1 cobalt transporter [Pseudomonas lalkuanensis]